MKIIFRFTFIYFLIALTTNSTWANDAKNDSLANVPYSINQISSETENTQRFLRNVNNQLNSSDGTILSDSVRLAEIAKVNKINDYLSNNKLENLDANQAENLQNTLRKEYDELNKMRQTMGDQEIAINAQLQQARLQKSRWEETLKANYVNELPERLIRRVKSNSLSLDSTINLLSSQNKSLLYHQDEITNAILLIEELQAQTKKKLDDYRTKIYDSNGIPIWKIGELSSDSISIRDNIKSSLMTKKRALMSYGDTYRNLFFFWLISFVILAFLILRIRHNFAKINRERQTKYKNETPYPFITALFMSTLLTLVYFPNTPSLITYLLQIALFIPALTLLPILWPRVPFKYFSFSVMTVAIVIITNILSDLAIINRVFMLVYGALLFSMYKTLLGWLKNHDRNTRSIPMNFTMLIVGSISIILSILCNILGNTYLMSVFFNGSITAVFGGVLLFSIRRLINNSITLVVEDKILGNLNIFEEHSSDIIHTSKKITHSLSIFLWFVLVAKSFVIFDPIYDWLGNSLSKPWTLGSMSISLGNIVAFVITFIFTLYLSKFIRFILEGEIFVRTHTSRGVAGAILMLVRLCLFAVGIILAMGAADIDVSNITLIFGALGVGIGFGLQTIFNNLASGIILAFERPIKAGDMIQIHSLDLWGEVKEIGIRASTITTFDGADVIVPNGNLLANEMINWTHSNHRRRQEVLVGVAYGTDLDKVVDILTKVVNSQSGIMRNPEPTIIFTGFGDSSLNFSIRFWTHFNDGLMIKSDIGIAIDKAFKQAGIEIPFPQRDLHIIQKGEDRLKVNSITMQEDIIDNILTNAPSKATIKTKNNEEKA